MSPHCIIAIDPGREKCGVAVLCGSKDSSVRKPEILFKATTETDMVIQTIERLVLDHQPDCIVVGDGTGSKDIIEKLTDSQSTPVETVCEKYSTLQARKRYFEENPPRGIRRLVPLSLQTPQENYDHYVAIILGEKYLSAHQA